MVVLVLVIWTIQIFHYLGSIINLENLFANWLSLQSMITALNIKGIRGMEFIYELVVNNKSNLEILLIYQNTNLIYIKILYISLFGLLLFP